MAYSRFNQPVQDKGRAKKKGKVSTSRVFLIIVVAAIVFAIIAGNDNTPTDNSSAPAEVAAPEIVQRPFSGDGYVPRFGTDFNAGLNSVDDLGLAVVIAVDLSGSMADQPAAGGDPKYLQTSRALAQIVNFLESRQRAGDFQDMKLKLGIIGFYEEVKTLYPLTEMNPTSFASLQTSLNDPNLLEPGGKTAIGLALEEGGKQLAQSGIILKSLIVISDGENNIDPEPLEVLQAINTNRNDASTVDFPVSTQGTLVNFIGYDIDSGYFDDLHAEGAGVTSAAAQEQLQAALRQILVADITRLEAAGN